MVNIINKKKRLILFSLLASLLVLVVSCNDEPTFMGSSLLIDTISIKSISTAETTLIVGSKSFLYRLEIFNSGAMFVGKFNDVEAISMIRFADFPNSLDKLTEADIDSLTLTLPWLKYAYGDSTNKTGLSFKVYQIIKYWSNKTSWDSLFPTGVPPTDYFDTKVLGSYSGIVDQKDTSAWKPIKIDLDKKLIIDWFKMASDTLTAGKIWGIALVPDQTCDVVRSLSSQTLTDKRVHPYIRVTYKKTQDSLDTLIFSSAIDASVTNSNPPDENSLTVQGAVSSRFKLRFDISSIPDEAAIHIAELDLSFDTLSSVTGTNNFDTTFLARLYLDSKYDKYLNDYYAYRDNVKKELFRFPNITSAIQYWIKNGKKGELVFLPEGIDNEYREFDKLIFRGLNYPDSTKRPSLKIIYSTRPKTGCKK